MSPPQKAAFYSANLILGATGPVPVRKVDLLGKRGVLSQVYHGLRNFLAYR
jgi:hypothetical protein